MKKILDALDFLKGKKLLLSSFFTVAAIVGNLSNINISETELMNLFLLLTDQTEIILGAIGMMYGGVFKIIRKFKK